MRPGALLSASAGALPFVARRCAHRRPCLAAFRAGKAARALDTRLLPCQRLSARPRCILLPPEPGGSEALLTGASRSPAGSAAAPVAARGRSFQIARRRHLAASLHPKFAHRVPAQASHRRPLAAVRLQAALPSRLFPSRPSSEAAERCLTGRPAATGCSPSRRAVDASGVLATHRVEACASTCRQASQLTSRELRPILVKVFAQAASSLP